MRRTFAAFFVASLALPALLVAQTTSDPNAIDSGISVTHVSGDVPETFGSQNTYATYPAWSAQPIDSTVTFALYNGAANGGQGIYRTGGALFFKLPLNLPNGAVVTKIELNYCDTGANSIALHFVRQVKNAAPVFTSNVVASPGAGAPGCVVETGVLGTPITIDNDANSYNLEYYMGAADNTIVLLSTRVGYHLQVSPAPAVATFTDVPTGHPFFRFVEALAAAGITGGCGSGLYCPDNPVTRGQMAVFLSVALGLHFPN